MLVKLPVLTFLGRPSILVTSIMSLPSMKKAVSSADILPSRNVCPTETS
ncbi:hypothetical protein EVA_06756 [gut metagenome]|uniref:Uncharacterized protein n=1 Tax=gut metagenome TaxID=749906 RepID=J9GE09_9ZZZZ